jgi:hypothetical protein
VDWSDRFWVNLFHFNGLPLSALRPLKVHSLSLRSLIPKTGHYWLGRLCFFSGQALSRHCPTLKRFLPYRRKLWLFNEYHLLQVDIFCFYGTLLSRSQRLVANQFKLGARDRLALHFNRAHHIFVHGIIGTLGLLVLSGP